MPKAVTTAPKGALARVKEAAEALETSLSNIDEIDADAKAHRLRAASAKFERRLHQIRTLAYEAEGKARAEYLGEVAQIDAE